MARLRITSSISRSHLEAVAKQEFLHSLAGGLIGLICLGVGVYLIVAWFMGPVTTIAIPIPGATDVLRLPAGPAGIIAAFVGVAVLWISRASVAD